MTDIVETLLRFKLDKSSLNETSRGANTARGVIDDYVDSLKDVSPAAKQALRAVGDYFDASSADATRLARQLTEQLDLYRKLGSAAQSAQRTQGSAGGSGGSLAGGIDRAGTIGSQIFGALGQSELANAAGFVGDFGGAIEAAGAKAALGVVGMAALSAALAFFNSENNKAAATVRTLISTQEEYYRVIQSGTRDQLQAALEAAQLEADIIRAQVEENRAILAAFEQEVGGVRRAVSDALNLAGARELRERTQELEQQLGATEFQVERFTAALANNATAAADAAVARERIDALLADSVLTSVSLAERDVRIQQQAQDATRQSAEARIAAIENERAVLSAGIAELEQFAEGNEELSRALQERRRQLQSLTLEEQALTQALRGRIAQQERAREALEGFNRTLEAAARASTAIRESERRRIESIAQIQADTRNKINELEAQAGERRLDIERNANEQALQAREKATIDLAKIERDFTRSRRSAIRDRNAIEFVEAKEARADGLTDQRTQLDLETAQRERAYARQNSDLQRNLRQQIDAANNAARSQTTAAAIKYSNEVAAARASVQAAAAFNQQRIQLDAQAYSLILQYGTSVQQQLARTFSVGVAGIGLGASVAALSATNFNTAATVNINNGNINQATAGVASSVRQALLRQYSRAG